MKYNLRKLNHILTVFTLLIFLSSLYYKYNNRKISKKEKNKKSKINKYKKLFREYKLSILESNNQTLLKYYYKSLISKYCSKKDLEFKNNPFISIIIPIYKNKKEYILRSLLSIEAQTLKNIEIIYIDDYSQDDSINLIKILKLIDNRITLIKNNINRGILYSKSLGVKNSRGKYVIVIDQDDIFLSKKLLNTIYKKAEKYNLDILQYNKVIFF